MNRLFIFLLLFLFPFYGFGQDQPKIGLVLSGGGAKGFAHIGALKVIEEAGIKIDYISGTSMGAIVGGLYASGWCAHQIDSIIHEEDFSVIMVDEVPRSVKPIFNKEYGEKYALSISVKDFKIKLPSAVSNGQNAFNFFNRLTRHVSHIDDFEQLPIPFVAFGTNAENGKEVVFENGNLARAIRASGAFPGLITPYEIDGKLITDGGIVNNFPAKILRDKGMDIVIGVNVEDGLYGKEELSGIHKIIEQVSSFQMVERSRAQRKYCDLIIYPEIKGYSVANFEKVDTLIKLGIHAARAKWDSLKLFSTNNEDRGVHELILTQMDSIDVSDIFISKNPTFTDEKILEFFGTPLPGRIAEKDFYDGITRLYGTNTQQYIDYYFSKNDTEGLLLTLNPKPKIGYDRQLRLGIHFDNVYKSNLLLNATLLNLGSTNSITSFNLIIGDNVRYTANYLADFGKAPDVGFNSRLDLNTVPVELPILFPNDTSFRNATFDFDYVDWSQDVYVRFFSNNNQTVGLSGELKYYRSSTDQLVGNNKGEMIGEEGVYFTAGAFSKYDSRDNENFPEKGLYSNFQFRYIRPLTSQFYDDPSGVRSYNLDWSFLRMFKLTGNLSIGLAGNFGFTSEEATPPYTYFLGGNNQNFINNFKAFEGLSYAQEFGSNLMMGSLYGQIRPFKNHYGRLGINLALLSDSFDNFTNRRAVQSISASYGIDTPIGPVALTGAISNEGAQAYFNLGHWF